MFLSFSNTSLMARPKCCHLVKSQPFTMQPLVLMTLRKRPLENNVRKGENAGNQQCFLPILKYINFLVAFTMSSANAFSLVQSRILSCVILFPLPKLFSEFFYNNRAIIFVKNISSFSKIVCLCCICLGH